MAAKLITFPATFILTNHFFKFFMTIYFFYVAEAAIHVTPLSAMN